jgi:hypothetical protein
MQDLLAVYALDAVEPTEAEAIELHLRECGRCRAEVADHRERAALLAIGHQPAPVDVWDRIAAALDDVAPPSALVLPLTARPRHRAIQVVVACVAAVAIVLLGVAAGKQGRRLGQMQAALQDQALLWSALAAHTRPDARRVELRSGDGAVLAHAVMTPDGSGFLWSDGLLAVADDRTYQLWSFANGEKTSAGVLGVNPKLVAFRVSGNVLALAITEEAAGGVVATEKQPVGVGVVQGA